RFWELQAFAQFASDLDKVTQSQLARGQRIVEILKQPQYTPVTVADQVIVIYAATNGYVDSFPTDALRRWETEFLAFVHSKYPDLPNAITTTGKFEDDTEQNLKKAAEAFNETFRA